MDTGTVLLNITAVLALVFLNGFFVAAEFAMVKVRETRLDSLIKEGHKNAKYAKILVKNLDAYLSACQLGITLASLGLGWVGEPAIAGLITPFFERLDFSPGAIHTISLAIAFFVITVLHIVWGELAPKTIAIQKAESVVLWTALPLIMFDKVMYPFIHCLNWVSRWFLRQIGFKDAEEEEVHSDDEIRALIVKSQDSGMMQGFDKDFFENVFEFVDTTIREIMVPRTDMICLFVEDSFEENLGIALENGRTRYPLCDSDKDHILGYIHIRDLFRMVVENQEKDLKKIVRDILWVSDKEVVREVLKTFQNQKCPMAVVLDEYGGTAGIVTLEDVLEEIIGEIQDEFDWETPLLEEVSEVLMFADGTVPLDEVEKATGLEFESDHVQTLGGWMISQVEIPPKEKAAVELENYRFTIVKAEGLRILRVQIDRLYEKSDELEENE